MRLTHHLFLWLWIGFIGGTGILFLIAMPLAARLRTAGTAQKDIDFILTTIAGAWVVASAIAACFVGRRLQRSVARIRAHACGVLLSAAVFVAFLQAGSGPFSTFLVSREVVTERFIFGPYPDEAEIKRLAGEGFTGIITLLSPIIPFEAVLLAQERAAARAAGLELVEAPMFPWVSANEEVLAMIRQLVESGTGRYYVHCYAGRDRTDLARSVILEATGIKARPLGTGETSAIGLISLSPDWLESSVWWNPNWQYRRKLILRYSAQAEDLTDFPLLVKLTGANFDFSLAQTSGQDLRFLDADNATQLSYEIESWDPARQEAYVWVKVPQIAAAPSADHIWLYFGNPSAPDSQDPSRVWSNGYVLVHHNQNSALLVPDSTYNAHIGIPAGMASESTIITLVPSLGKLGGALALDGTTGITVPNTPSLGLGTGNYTVEVWVKTSALAEYRRIVTKYNSDTTTGFGLTEEPDGTAAFTEWVTGGINNAS
ncbi:MAG: DUF2341 domain-containing protein, partial [Deinococcus sp.]|nr:DUF2341 domain-containing protein [Deinococcus sp.]